MFNIVPMYWQSSGPIDIFWAPLGTGGADVITPISSLSTTPGTGSIVYNGADVTFTPNASSAGTEPQNVYTENKLKMGTGEFLLGKRVVMEMYAEILGSVGSGTTGNTLRFMQYGYGAASEYGFMTRMDGGEQIWSYYFHGGGSDNLVLITALTGRVKYQVIWESDNSTVRWVINDTVYRTVTTDTRANNTGLFIRTLAPDGRGVTAMKFDNFKMYYTT